MDNHDLNAIIAGASGLVGDELLHQLLANKRFKHIYALSRRDLPFHSSKLHQIIDPLLRINSWEHETPQPQYGFICLGTTKRKAGSKSALAAVDLDLVKDVATTMKNLGVKHIIVVSSLVHQATLLPITYAAKEKWSKQSLRWGLNTAFLFDQAL
nr:NAD-dependent epimerase/dehydratase family protein [Photobacterium angustum]